ncbi:MAG TPA: hypothetical protein VNO30_20610 [Kofleriaceae bacterium]|nr:hypothetical protein [Kofleriaceae bacterium]
MTSMPMSFAVGATVSSTNVKVIRRGEREDTMTRKGVTVIQRPVAAVDGCTKQAAAA